ncbi:MULTISPECIES: PLDc N-terminal domain-containing protein [Paraliobacillus]|uniref:PLDc N-terminal domain-containing protein n=1 Tax=Paraliobacillus TaxID=200903 RepID=UPI000DD43AF6|nr:MULTISPECIES: PLDc N-terminal domain-containing protein [Paraliobacillus]
MADLLPILFPIILLEGILAIVGIVAWFKTDKTNGSKWLWLFVIIVIGIIGPILFFIFGRRQD